MPLETAIVAIWYENLSIGINLWFSIVVVGITVIGTLTIHIIVSAVQYVAIFSDIIIQSVIYIACPDIAGW